MTLRKVPPPLAEGNRETVRLGVIDRADSPVLSIDSGDEVSIETWSGWGNSIDTSTTIGDVMARASTLDEAGPHDLTGPIEVRGAQPGQVLRVDVLELKPGAHATNVNIPGAVGVGLLPDLFPEGSMRHYTLNRERMTVDLAPNLTVPSAPVGSWPLRHAMTGRTTASRLVHTGGNIDLKDLVVGSTLYLPIWNAGALFYAGDGHALQGNGEVNVTALEAPFEEARLRLSVIDGPTLSLPQRRPTASGSLSAWTPI